MGQEKLDAVDDAAIKAVGLFGGGIAHSGNTCGALLGAIATISSMYSRGSLEEKESPVMWDVGDRFIAEFTALTAEHGGIRCMDIARVDFKDPEAVRQFRTSPDSRRRICADVVGKTAQALGELIERQTSGS